PPTPLPPRHPPPPPLSPYTTLFRSHSLSYDALSPELSRMRRLPPATACALLALAALPLAAATVSGKISFITKRGQNPVVNETLVDRKSTRLNSSHVSISYAVFCLKK